MEDKATQRLESKLDAMIRLLAAPLVEGKTIAEAADKLDRLGIHRDVIASICQTTPETVRVTLFNYRKKQGGQRNAARRGGRAKAS